MVIESAEIVFEAHPHTTCVDIIGAYQGLVGLSITRGFTHKVRELFGGPRGCTHTTALLLAMGPVATQCSWSMYAADARREGKSFMASRADMTPEQREMSLRRQPQHVPRVGRGRRDDRHGPRRRSGRDDAADPQALRRPRRPRGGVVAPGGC